MAENTDQTQGTHADQPIGQVFVIFGDVKAIAPDDSVRVLGPNSPVFPDERIVTGGDGRVSITFFDSNQSTMSLGRNSDILINEDVYIFAGNQDLADITSEIEDIQRALTEGEFDPNLAFQPTSSGPTAADQDPNTDEPASDGGNLSFTVFDLTADEVVPQAGAETIGVTADFMDPDIPTTPPEGDLLPTTPTQTPTTPTQTPTTPTQTPTTPTETPTTPTQTPTTPTETPTTPTQTPTTPTETPTTPTQTPTTPTETPTTPTQTPTTPTETPTTPTQTPTTPTQTPTTPTSTPTTPTSTPTTPTSTPTTPTSTPTTPTSTPTTPTSTPTTPTSTPTTPTSTPTTPDDDDDDNGQQYEGIEAEDDGGLVDDFDVPQPTETY